MLDYAIHSLLSAGVNKYLQWFPQSHFAPKKKFPNSSGCD